MSSGKQSFQTAIDMGQKIVFLTCNQDYYRFVEAVYKALNSKVTVKLVMDNPHLKAKQHEHVSFFLPYRGIGELILVMFPGA
jgi:hypothetical protein